MLAKIKPKKRYIFFILNYKNLDRQKCLKASETLPLLNI